jgi:alkylhydroperoxidase/carboxymuconolactone decarboxylase family protein YurZ
MITSQNAKQNENITIGHYTFGVVQMLKYLVSSLSFNNDISQKMKKWILVANKCFYGLRNQLKSHVLSWKSKIILYKTLIKPVLTYA